MRDIHSIGSTLLTPISEEARRNVMPTLLLHTSKTTLLALAVAAILAGPGHADSSDPHIQSAASAAVLGALVRDQDAKLFQLQQQQLREQDRHSNQQPLQLEIP